MLKLRIGSTAVMAACVCALSACGGPKTYEVTGDVSYEGQPVEKGQISFVPASGGGAAEGGVIENGKYSIRATPGKKRVEIRASRPLPPERQNSPEMGLLYEDYIPEQYNSQSTLSAEVTASNRQFDFQLAPPQ